MSTKTAPARQSDVKRIHVLGIGNIGCLFSHSLASLPNPPPITLLLHRPELVDAWRKNNEAIDLITDGSSHLRKNVEVETIDAKQKTESPTITNLIVAVKSPQTVAALGTVKHRLTPLSNVLFLQNGMGAVDEVVSTLYPAAEERPNFIQGITSIGIWHTQPFIYVYAGAGITSLGIIPRETSPGTPLMRDADTEIEEPNPPEYMPNLITQSPILNARFYPYPLLLQLQLEKLVINAVANPLSAIINTDNEVLLTESIRPVVRSLCTECSRILLSFPELREVEGVKERFSPDKLEELNISTFLKVRKNVSSMCQDMRAGKRTEIDYINGYLVRRAKELGIACELNSTIVQLIKAKEEMAAIGSKG